MAATGCKGIHEKQPELSLCTRTTGLSAPGVMSLLGAGCAAGKGTQFCRPVPALLLVPAKASQFRVPCAPTPARRAAAGTAKEEKIASEAIALARGILQ